MRTDASIEALRCELDALQISLPLMDAESLRKIVRSQISYIKAQLEIEEFDNKWSKKVMGK